jgi:GxxExxY protein
MAKETDRKTKLLHAELSYAIRGVLLDVHNALGPGLPEQFYDDAAGIGYQEAGIACERQKIFDIFYRNVLIGRHIPDATFNDQVILDYKVAPAITPLHKAQVLSYLKVTDADLGLVANFGEARLNVERLPNFLRERQPVFNWQPQPLPADILYPELSAALFECLYGIHFALGPGFVHRIYRRATMVELDHAGLNYRHVSELPITYHGHHLGVVPCQLIIVENKIAIAAVALQEAGEAEQMTLRARLRQLDLKLGLLANFYNTRLTIHPVRVPNQG